MDLDFVDGEVLAEEGDGGELGDFGKVSEGALEIFLIGEDGEA